MIEFSAFRAMLSAIPNLTTLVLYGQPLRFRTDPVGSLPGDMHGSGVSANSAIVMLPHLHTLILHPGVLKPRYLQHTISAIHAPALRHFELVFPDSKILGQNIVERLFMDSLSLSPIASSSSSSVYASSLSTRDEYLRRRRTRFPCVETLVLNNASSAGTALAFIHAFPNITQLTLGRVDVGSFSLVLHANAGPSISASSGVGSTGRTEQMIRPGIASRSGTIHGDDTYTRFACWHRLDTITVRHPRQEALRILLDWVQHASERGLCGVPSMLVIQASSLEKPEIQYFAQRARAYARVELVATQDFGTGTV